MNEFVFVFYVLNFRSEYFLIYSWFSCFSGKLQVLKSTHRNTLQLFLTQCIFLLFFYGIFPLIIPASEFLSNLQHSIYPSILAMVAGILIAQWNFSCFKALCDSIKQKRYLLGNQLINNEDTR